MFGSRRVGGFTGVETGVVYESWNEHPTAFEAIKEPDGMKA